MRIFITGGTGFLGTILTKKLIANEQEVTILTRSPKRKRVLPESIFLLQGNPTQPGPWQSKVAEHDVIINLAGASIFCRWNKKAKQEILRSRLSTTKNIVNALSLDKRNKRLLLNASAVGYYGFRGDEIVDEKSSPGNDFLATVVSSWERSAQRAEEFGTRVVLCRFGLVLGKRGGALSPMRKAFEFYLGSRFGNGKQWFSWIHEEDIAEILMFLMEHQELDGPINCTSPNPVTNEELTKILSQVLAKPVIFPSVPSFALKMILGEFAEILLHGQRVLPSKLLASGFHHKFPELKQALEDLLEERVEE